MLEYLPSEISLSARSEAGKVNISLRRERGKNNSVPRDKWTKARLKQKTVFPCGALLGSYSVLRGLRLSVYLS